MNDKEMYNYTFTWTQPYYQLEPLTFGIVPQSTEDNITDLTEANELIARIKNGIRD